MNRIRSDGMKKTDPRAKPFNMKGSGTRCLLVHGLTASPSEMRFLGEYLHERGYSVCAPLLPGHGTSVEDLSATHWPEWYLAVGEAAERLTESDGPVIIVGLSMGALLALEAAARVKGITGVVAINPPFKLKDRKSDWARVAKVFRKYYPKTIGDEDLELAAQGRFAYDQYSLKALVSMKALARDVVGRLENIDIPVLALESGQDEIVDCRSCSILARGLPAGRCQHIVLPEARHVATMGDDKVRLAEEIFNFIQGLPGTNSQRKCPEGANSRTKDKLRPVRKQEQ